MDVWWEVLTNIPFPYFAFPYMLQRIVDDYTNAESHVYSRPQPQPNMTANEKPVVSDRILEPSAARPSDIEEAQDSGHTKRRVLALRTVGTIASQLVALAWLAPIISLLVLNFQGYIAGASVGCGVTHCEISQWGMNVTQLVGQLDTQDRNILGALQLVAKALEIWFVFVAGHLVYDLAMVLARGGDGLPLRYYTMNVEFADLLTICSPSFWTSVLPPPSDSNPPTTSTTTRKRLLIAFALCVGSLSIIANLMGPAIAVLVLPTLGWRDLPLPQKTTIFGEMAASDPPSTAMVNADGFCEASQLEDGDYTCLQFAFYTDLDASISIFSLTDRESQISSLDQSFVTFSLNLTDSLWAGEPAWAMNRQALERMSDDFAGTFSLEALEELTDAPMTPSQYKTYQNSIQTQLQRRAPALSAVALCHSAFFGLSVIEVSEERSVRCYNMPTGDLVTDILYPYPETGLGLSTMCIPSGSGWPGTTSHARYFVGSDSSSSEEAVAVNIYSAYRAIYLDSSTFHCANISDNLELDAPPLNTRQDRCDWDALFEEPPEEHLISDSGPLQLTEYIIDGSVTEWCRTFAYLRFATYNLDISFNSNPFNWISIEGEKGVASTDRSIYVHPHWTLAAWATARDGVVPGDRPGAAALLARIRSGEFVAALHYIITLYALTLINYQAEPLNTSTVEDDPRHPALTANALIRVWYYDLHSRTSTMGAVVAIIGCVCVVLQTVVALLTRNVPRSLTGLLSTALKQSPVAALGEDPEESAERVRLLMVNDKSAEFTRGSVGEA